MRALDVSVDPWDPTLVEWADEVGVLGADAHRAPASPATSRGGHRTKPGALLRALRRASAPTSPTAGRLGCRRSRPRDLLPPLDRYARLVVGGEQQLVGSVARVTRLRAPLPALPGAGRVRRARAPRRRGRGARRHRAARRRRAPRHITFGDPDFLNAPPHSRRIVARDARAIPRRHLRLHGQGRARPSPRRRLARVRRRRLRVRGLCVRVGRRRSARAARQGPHRRRRRPCGRDPARRGHRRSAVVAAVHAVDDARRRPSRCSTSCTSTTSSAASTPCSTACDCCSPRARCCSSIPTSPPHLGPWDPERSHLHVDVTRPRGRRAPAAPRRPRRQRRRTRSALRADPCRGGRSTGRPRTGHDRPPAPHRELVLLRRADRDAAAQLAGDRLRTPGLDRRSVK